MRKNKKLLLLIIPILVTVSSSHAYANGIGYRRFQSEYLGSTQYVNFLTTEAQPNPNAPKIAEEMAIQAREEAEQQLLLEEQRRLEEQEKQKNENEKHETVQETVQDNEPVPSVEPPVEQIVPTTGHYYAIPDYSGFKSYESYEAITQSTSQQYAVQQMAYTDENGFRRVGYNYVIAIGNHFNIRMGEEFFLVLENGTVIPCVKGDIKATAHTDSSRIFSQNGCCSEFIVSVSDLNGRVKRAGDVSYLYPEWRSPVRAVVTYT